MAPLMRRRKTKFPTVKPPIYLPKWQIWMQLSPKCLERVWYEGVWILTVNTVHAVWSWSFLSAYRIIVYCGLHLQRWFWSDSRSSIVINSSVLASVAQLDASSDWRPGGRGFNPRRGRQHSFVEIDHEIFSTVILSLPLIQEGQLSVSGKRMCTILVNRLED